MTGAETVRAAVLTGVGSVEVQERPRPVPRPDEVLVEVLSVGVCGSDTHYYEHGRIGSFVVEDQLVLGHEASGRIVQVGADVDPARVGERVSIEPGVPCRTCEQCLAGRYNLCPRMVFHATPPVDGSLVEIVSHHHAFVHPVPDGVDDDAAALAEPLSVGIWACRKGGVRLGSRVLVTGAGPVGILSAYAARAAGAAWVAVADVNPHRLAVVERMGFVALDVSAAPLDEALGGAREPEVLLECSGHEGSTVAGLHALARAGRAVLVGMGSDEMPLPVAALQERELVLTGVFRYANTWPTALGLLAHDDGSLAALVTGHFDLEHTADALTAAGRDPRAMKSMIHPGR
ncbi:NAD(P)-dependent alcohol dehydrogenase [Ornithinimicrobium avium]|uniref:NAD(P)-dependent alcohol dehydrogenase n=1 Tax=Ornithinimicrobium avium TaxID=2283195 RepID=A0A345NIT0_9MICO|nr:NAD(P)-dependent alcohol dehydrogenase [Ornithinimicrobium avium]AXH94938.1 NAD(P)-dependent alcohol dehydrogenase [Ornithinimicrobium avium]